MMARLPPPPLPVFDSQVLAAMFGGEAGVIATVLHTFRVSVGGSMQDIQSALRQQDLRAVGAVAHRIKGACHMSGTLALAQAAQQVEWAAKQGAMAAARGACAQLEHQWRLVQEDAALHAACGFWAGAVTEHRQPP